uniref:Polyketide synthase n=1 Tax=Peronospora matthiolae TaxID=2874970 RepID=A0AAV1UME7_9STRA
MFAMCTLGHPRRGVSLLMRSCGAGAGVHEAELLAVEDLAKPFSSPDKWANGAATLVVQQSADSAQLR